jgi:hypothetical protein
VVNCLLPNDKNYSGGQVAVVAVIAAATVATFVEPGILWLKPLGRVVADTSNLSFISIKK